MSDYYDEALVLRLLAGERHLLPGRGWLLAPYRGEIEEVIRRAHAAGWTDGEIARRTGFSSQTAYRIRKRLGLRAVPCPFTPRRHLSEAAS